MIALFGAQTITDYASTVRTRFSIVNMATKNNNNHLVVDANNSITEINGEYLYYEIHSNNVLHFTCLKLVFLCKAPENKQFKLQRHMVL